MKHTGTTHRPGAANRVSHPWKRSGLQARMTISYVWATVVSIVVLEALLLVPVLVVGSYTFSDLMFPAVAGRLAERYAFVAALQANESELNPQSTFLPGQPDSLISSYDESTLTIPETRVLIPDTQGVAFALLIAPNGDVLASSYPRQYPSNTLVSTLLPNRMAAIKVTLAGGPPTSAADQANNGLVAWGTSTVWSRERRPIGAVYLQGPVPPITGQPFLLPLLILLFVGGLISLVVIAPVGALFGLLTTRSIVRRVRQLVAATAEFAAGNYQQRVQVTRQDEVGQLEAQFNQMAEQLVDSINARQELAGENARLAERTRISRELHDAVSQDLFSLRMLVGGMQRALPPDSPLSPQIAVLQEMSTTMIREMRALLLELRPAQLEHLGLAEALEDLAAAYRTRLGITVTTSIRSASLSGQAEQALLRIAQEALSNAARHADGTAITLNLTPQEQTITLTITDNGQGFEPATGETQHGLGLRSMQERVQELGGSFVLESAPGQGTRVQVCLPLEPEHDLLTGASK